MKSRRLTRSLRPGSCLPTGRISFRRRPPTEEESQDPPPDPPEPPESQAGYRSDRRRSAPAGRYPAGGCESRRSPKDCWIGLRAPNIRGNTGAAGHSGALANAKQRGRPIGVRAQAPRSGARLNVVETLRAAAPWQRLRQSTTTVADRRVIIRPEDFRTTRFKQRSETMTVLHRRRLGLDRPDPAG